MRRASLHIHCFFESLLSGQDLLSHVRQRIMMGLLALVPSLSLEVILLYKGVHPPPFWAHADPLATGRLVIPAQIVQHV